MISGASGPDRGHMEDSLTGGHLIADAWYPGVRNPRYREKLCEVYRTQPCGFIES